MLNLASVTLRLRGKLTIDGQVACACYRLLRLFHHALAEIFSWLM